MNPEHHRDVKQGCLKQSYRGRKSFIKDKVSKLNLERSRERQRVRREPKVYILGREFELKGSEIRT